MIQVQKSFTMPTVEQCENQMLNIYMNWDWNSKPNIIYTAEACGRLSLSIISNTRTAPLKREREGGNNPTAPEKRQITMKNIFEWKMELNFPLPAREKSSAVAQQTISIFQHSRKILFNKKFPYLNVWVSSSSKENKDQRRHSAVYLFMV